MLLAMWSLADGFTFVLSTALQMWTLPDFFFFFSPWKIKDKWKHVWMKLSSSALTAGQGKCVHKVGKGKEGLLVWKNNPTKTE